MAEPGKKSHTLMLDNRSKLSLTGVEDVSGFNEEAVSVRTVSGFNEEAVSVRTTDGTLIIRGSGLHIDRLNLETGDVSVDGSIDSMQYLGSDGSKSKLSRLFR